MPDDVDLDQFLLFSGVMKRSSAQIDAYSSLRKLERGQLLDLLLCCHEAPGEFEGVEARHVAKSNGSSANLRWRST
jgi:hypothetical protein